MTISSRGACGVSSALAMLGVAATVHGQNLLLYVDDDAPAGGTGQSWAKAFNDLQLALDFADQFPGYVEIRVAEGIYTPGRGTQDRWRSFDVRDRVGQVVVGSSMTLNLSMALLGGFAGVTSADPDSRNPATHPTVLSGDLAGDDSLGESHRAENSTTILNIEDCTEALVLDGLTVTGANADPSWGVAVYVYNAPDSASGGPVFRDCRIVDNRSQIGGFGVYGSCKRLTFERCMIARNGTGVYLGTDYLGCLTMRDTWLIDNSGYRGGAFSETGLRLERCVIAGNSASYRAGGVGQSGSYAGEVNIENCLFAGNSAGSVGGALLVGGWRTTLTNCTFADNSADYGGAIFDEGGDLLVRNCILVNNRATSGGPALAIDNLFGRARIFSSCIEGGEAGVFGYWDSLTWDESVLDVDPLFRDAPGPDGVPGTWADNDYRLALASPCVDKGDPAVQFIPDLDLDGLSRFAGNTKPKPLPDMGCYELQNPGCPSDFNYDGFVDPLDYNAFINAFEAGSPFADVNRDGFVDPLDYADFIRAFESWGC